MTGSFIYRLVLRRKFQSRVVIPCSQTKVFLFVYWWHQTFQLHPLLPSSFLIFQSFLFFLFFVGCSDRFCLLHCSCLVIWSVFWNLPCERHTQPPENILHYIHALVHKIKYKHAQTKTHNCNNILLQNILQAGFSFFPSIILHGCSVYFSCTCGLLHFVELFAFSDCIILICFLLHHL